MTSDPVTVTLDRTVAADVLALIRGFEGNYDHDFCRSLGKAVEPLRDVLRYEEAEQAADRYAAFAKDVEE